MKYQCQLLIDETLETVSYSYLEKNERLKWEAGLVDVVVLNGFYNQTGCKQLLQFEFEGIKSDMLETIE